MLTVQDDGGDEDSVKAEGFPRFHKLSLLHAVWRRKRLVSIIWALLATGAIFAVQSIQSTYRAEAIVLVDSQKIPEAFVSSTVNGELADRLALISENIMTSDRLLQIIGGFDLYRAERKHLTQEELLRKMRLDISIEFEKSWTGGRTQAFRLGYEGPNARVVTDVTNRLAGLYVAENARARENQAEETVDFLSRQLREAKQSLDDQERKVAEFKQGHNGSLPQQETSLLATLSNFNVELQGTQAAIARAQEAKLSLEASLSAAQASDAALRSSLTSEGRFDPGQNVVRRSEILAERLEGLRSRYTAEHPAIQQAEMQLHQAESEETRSRAARAASNSGSTPQLDVSNPRTGQVSPALLQSRERIASLQAQLDVAKHQIESLDRQRHQTLAAIAQCEARIYKLPLVEQEMAGLKRNYDQSATAYNSLLQKKLAAGIATDMERSHKSERFTVIDPARIPHVPVKPKRLLFDIIGSVVALLLAMGVALTLHSLKQVFLGEWELPSDIRILGRVPLCTDERTSPLPGR